MAEEDFQMGDGDVKKFLPPEDERVDLIIEGILIWRIVFSTSTKDSPPWITTNVPL